MKVIKITTDNHIVIVDLNFDDYDAIRKEIGGYFESVSTRRLVDYFGRPVVMLVDDDGIRKHLPMNPVASLFYGAGRSGSYIYGDVILAVRAGEDIVAPAVDEMQEWRDRLMRDFWLTEKIVIG